MRILYTLSILAYGMFIRLASLFNGKAKEWVSGRENYHETLKKSFKNTKGIVWFHCSSLGEFEQGRTLIESWKTHFPEDKILLTFFSPSGYRVRKNYAYADYVFYLPLDTPWNASKFVEIVKPRMAIFVKYDFWFNFLKELKNENIPVYFISSLFRSDQYFFRFYGVWFKKQLRAVSHFFVQDESSKMLLKKIGISEVSVSGDTRFDRVLQIAAQAQKNEIMEHFCDGKFVLIGGSIWQEDLAVLSAVRYDFSTLKIILAPHEINEKVIMAIENAFSKAHCLRYSKANAENAQTANILILDNVGMLNQVYRYASLAFVGGGFGKSVHNIMEPAVCGIPVVFGPNFQLFKEARDLIDIHSCRSVKTIQEWLLVWNEFSLNDLKRKEAGEANRNYIKSNAGATEKITSYLLAINH